MILLMLALTLTNPLFRDMEGGWVFTHWLIIEIDKHWLIAGLDLNGGGDGWADRLWRVNVKPGLMDRLERSKKNYVRQLQSILCLIKKKKFCRSSLTFFFLIIWPNKYGIGIFSFKIWDMTIYNFWGAYLKVSYFFTCGTTRFRMIKIRLDL